MDPSNNETGSFQLPPPVMEQAPAPGAEAQLPAVEAPAPAAERTSAAPPPAASAAQATALPVMPTTPQPAVQATTQAVTPPLADDSDLIEKEWVDKAKQIVEKTRDDPYKQSEELTVVKADYLQQRYNKTIKLNK